MDLTRVKVNQYGNAFSLSSPPFLCSSILTVSRTYTVRSVHALDFVPAQCLPHCSFSTVYRFASEHVMRSHSCAADQIRSVEISDRSAVRFEIIHAPKVLKEARCCESVLRASFPFRSSASKVRANGPSMHVHWSIHVWQTVLQAHSSSGGTGEPTILAPDRQSPNLALWATRICDNAFMRSSCETLVENNQYQLIPKTIGNRKGDCAWCCSRWQTQPEKICKSQRTNQCHSLRTLYWFVLCNLLTFSGCVCHLKQLSFSISNSFWY